MFGTALLLAALLVPSPLPASEDEERSEPIRPHEAYLRVLDDVARGEVESAAAGLAALEAQWEGAPRAASDLRRAQRSLGKKLGRRAPEALLPLALLHQRAFVIHAEAGRRTLANAASDRADVLALAYSRAGDRRLAAALFTNLGRLWHARAQEPAAAPFYRRALELDPQQPAALLGLAVVYEKHGWLRDASSLLDDVAGHAPEDRETRLRRALVRARSGDPVAALDALDGLAREEADDWIAALAHQERARLLAAAGRVAEAFEAARLGRSRLPCDPALPVLASYYAERSGAADAGIAATLGSCAGVEEPSPRRLYNQQPRRLLELSAQRLEQAERERLDELHDALRGRAAR
jgi:tetratricopeptide (TPR) repeat protein